jgi:hypothetical protein
MHAFSASVGSSQWSISTRPKVRAYSGARLLHDRARDPGGVVHRVGVGHRAYGGEAAGRGGARPGCDRLLVLAAGLTQVGVDVDEAGAHHQPIGVDHLGASGGKVRAQLLHRAVHEQHVERRVDALRRVDDTPALH